MLDENSFSDFGNWQPGHGDTFAKDPSKVFKTQELLHETETDEQESQQIEPHNTEDYISSLREKLRKIFVFYASFGSRCNSEYLKPSQFIKMMIDAEISDDYINQRKLDIIFLKACRKSKLLKFENFLELLFLLAQKKYRREVFEPNKKFKLLLGEYIEPLFETIYNETEMGIEDQIFNCPISLSTLLIIKMIAKPLKTLYTHFFKYEANRPLNDKPSRSKLESEMFKFLKSFEICPQLITKSVSHSLLTEVLAIQSSKLDEKEEYKNLGRILGKDLGDHFTFFRFVIYVIRLGIYIFSDVNNIPINQKEITFTSDEKVYLLLERMDISSGISKIGHLLGKGMIQHHVLTIERPKLSEIHKETDSYPNFFAEEKKVESMYPLQEKETNYCNNSDFMYMKLAEKGKQRTSRSKSRSSVSRAGSKKSKISQKENSENQNTSIASGHESNGPNFVIGESYDIFERYLEEVHKIFEFYCSYLDPQNFSMLKAVNFVKCMRDARIVGDPKDDPSCIPGPQIDLIFHEIANGNNPLKPRKNKRKSSRLRKSSYSLSSESQNIQQGKSKNRLDFTGFLQALEVVALSNDREQSHPMKVLDLIENRLIPLTYNNFEGAFDEEGGEKPNMNTIAFKGEYYTYKLVSLLKDKSMIDILGAVHKVILPLYIFYADDNKQINEQNYKRFMKDFGIFPEMLSHSKLSQLFHEMSVLYQSKAIDKIIGDEAPSFIDQHLFVESLALVSQEPEYSGFQLTPPQKVNSFLMKADTTS